jgi:branched-chain amino acid transport system permease protein
MAVIASAATRSFAVPAALKESLITALVALALAAPMVGLRTIDVGGSLTVEPHFNEVAVAVALVFVGRFGLVLIREGHALPILIASLLVAVGSFFTPFPTVPLHLTAVAGGLVVALRAGLAFYRRRSTVTLEERDRRMDRVGAVVQNLTVYIGPIVIFFAVVLPFLPFSDRYVLDIGILVLTYVMLGWGLNIVVGLAGLLDLGYVAFYAVGAYSYALLGRYFGFSFWVCLPLAGLFAATAGVTLGFPVLRLRGDYFAIVTLGFGEIIRIVLINWSSFTGGPAGVSDIPRPSFFGIAKFAQTAPEGGRTFHELLGINFSTTQRVIFLYYLILVLALIVNFFTLRIRRLPIGRAWEALREDDIACTSLGINRTNIKLAAFMISAMFGGFAGSFFATRQGFISPESFNFLESAIILAIVVLGGMGSQAGVVLAAILLIGVPEVFRELQQYRMLAFGVAMVLIMIWRPRGLLAHREPTILLHDRPRLRRRSAPAGEGA